MTRPESKETPDQLSQDLGLMDISRKFKLVPHAVVGSQFLELSKEHLVTLATQVKQHSKHKSTYILI